MTCFSFSQLEGIWTGNGGSPIFAPMAAAIAMAESGGCSDATGHNSNGSVDRGLWQINSSNGSLSTTDINGNALAAIKISNNGANWRPWCTAYSDGACGTKGGSFLGTGSPYQKFFNGTNAGASQAPSGTSSGQPQQAQTLAATNFSICKLPIKFPLVNFCMWYDSWSRAALGGLILAAAFATGIAGFFLITMQSKTVQGAFKDVSRTVMKGAKIGALVA